MNRYITPFLITILLVAICIVTFALIYHHLHSDSTDPYTRGWMHSFYTAVTIQTNIGMAEVPERDKVSLRAWYIVQSLLSYIITLGLIFFIYKAYFMNNGKK
jgi:cyanate permease